MTLKFCPECGFKLDKQYKFCPSCGYNVGCLTSQTTVVIDSVDNANDLFKQGKIDDAIAMFERLLDKDVRDKQAFLGLLMAKTEGYTKFLVRDVEEDLAIAPNMFACNDLCKDKAFKDYMVRRGIFLFAKNKVDLALDFYNKWLAQDSQTPDVFVDIIKIKTNGFAELLGEQTDRDVSFVLAKFDKSQLDKEFLEFLSARDELIKRQQEEEKRRKEEQIRQAKQKANQEAQQKYSQLLKKQLRPKHLELISQQGGDEDILNYSADVGFYFVNKEKTAVAFGYFDETTSTYSELPDKADCKIEQLPNHETQMDLTEIVYGLWQTSPLNRVGLVNDSWGNELIIKKKNKATTNALLSTYKRCTFNVKKPHFWDVLKSDKLFLEMIFGDKIVLDRVEYKLVDGKYDFKNSGINKVLNDFLKTNFTSFERKFISQVRIPTMDELKKYRQQITPKGDLARYHSYGKYGSQDYDWLITGPNDGSCYWVVKETPKSTKQTEPQVDVVEIKGESDKIGTITQKIAIKPILEVKIGEILRYIKTGYPDMPNKEEKTTSKNPYTKNK